VATDLATARALVGQCRLGPVVACDGGTDSTVRWVGERGELEVTITLDGGRIAAAAVHARAIGPG
jgi:hypothetical protein